MSTIFEEKEFDKNSKLYGCKVEVTGFGALYFIHIIYSKFVVGIIYKNEYPELDVLMSRLDTSDYDIDTTLTKIKLVQELGLFLSLDSESEVARQPIMENEIVISKKDGQLKIVLDRDFFYSTEEDVIDRICKRMKIVVNNIESFYILTKNHKINYSDTIREIKLNKAKYIYIKDNTSFNEIYFDTVKNIELLPALEPDLMQKLKAKIEVSDSIFN